MAHECISSSPDTNFWRIRAAVPFSVPAGRFAHSCWQLPWAAASCVPLPPQHGWATHGWAGCVTALLCGVLPQTGERGDAEEASGQDRRSESSGLGGEMLWVDTKPSEPNTARPHPCTHTCTAQKLVSWKQTKVSGDPLEVTLSTKITNTIDNSTKPSAFSMSSKTLPVPDVYQYAILSKSWFICIFPQNYSEQSLSTGVEAELKGWFCLGSWIWGEIFLCFFSREYSNLILKLFLKTLSFSCMHAQSSLLMPWYSVVDTDLLPKFISMLDTIKNYYILWWDRLY